MSNKLDDHISDEQELSTNPLRQGDQCRRPTQVAKHLLCCTTILTAIPSKQASDGDGSGMDDGADAERTPQRDVSTQSKGTAKSVESDRDGPTYPEAKLC